MKNSVIAHKFYTQCLHISPLCDVRQQTWAAAPTGMGPASHQQQQQSQLRARAIDDTNKSVKLPISHCLADCCCCSGAPKTAKTIVRDCCLIIAKRKQHVNGTSNGEDAHQRHFRFTALLNFFVQFYNFRIEKLERWACAEDFCKHP